MTQLSFSLDIPLRHEKKPIGVMFHKNTGDENSNETVPYRTLFAPEEYIRAKICLSKKNSES
jgi:hypothetical protein